MHTNTNTEGGEHGTHNFFFSGAKGEVEIYIYIHIESKMENENSESNNDADNNFHHISM